MKKIFENKKVLEITTEWHKGNKVALMSVIVILELAFYLMIFTVISFNNNTVSSVLNFEAVGNLWFFTAQAMLLYIWLFLAAINDPKKYGNSKVLQMMGIFLYVVYITCFFYHIGFTSIVTGVTLVATSLVSASLLSRRILWRAFVVSILLILSVSLLSTSSTLLPTLHEMDKYAISFSDDDYSLFWTFFHYLLAFPKAIFSVSFCLYLYGSMSKQLKKAQYSASYDELTGVKNRRFIMNYLFDVAYNKDNKSLNSSSLQDISVIIIDLDYFKVINDTHGHLSGDMVLIEVAKRLTDGMLKPSWQASRYGGEEFLVVLPEVTHTTAMKVSEHIHNLIKETSINIVDGLSISVTSSIGVATLFHDEVVGMRSYYKQNSEEMNKSQQGRSNKLHVDEMTNSSEISQASNHEELIIESLINMADQALYDAKRNGRNQIKSAHSYIDVKNAKIDRDKNMIIADQILDTLTIETA